MNTIYKKTLIILIAIFAIMMLITLKSNANTQDSASVATTEEFIEAANNPDIININVTSDDIDFTVYGMVFSVTGKTIDLNNHTIKTSNFANIFQGSNFTIKNGTFDGKGGSYSLFIGDVDETDNVLIKNIKGIGGFNIFNAHNVVIEDCNVTGTNYYAIWCDPNGQVIIKSGTYSTSSNSGALIGLSAKENETKLEIQGGNYFTNGKNLVLQGNNDEYNIPEISGGIFDTSVNEKYLKNGYEVIEIEENKYTVCNHANTKIVNKTEATCTKDGYTGDTLCAKCNKKIKTGSIINAKGHSISDWKTDEKNHWKECTVENCKTIIEGTKQEHIKKNGKCEVCGYKMPIEVETVTNKDTNIELEYAEDIMPNDIRLEVDKIEKDANYDKIEKELKEVSRFELFDINLLKNGEKIQPNGKVKLRIPIPEEFDKERLAVYRIEETEKIEYDITIVKINGKEFVQFETDHFSNYVLAEKKKENNTDNNLDNNKNNDTTNVDNNMDKSIDTKDELEEPKTGTNSINIIIISLLTTSIVGYIVCKRKMYN